MFQFLKREKSYYMEPFIYLNENTHRVSNQITGLVMFLEKFSVAAKNETDATKIAFEIVEQQYPEYKGKIWIL